MNALIENVNNSDIHVFGVPSNIFYMEEPGKGLEILHGIKHVRPGGGFELANQFVLTNKVDVNGENEHAMFTHLKNSCPRTSVNIGNPDYMYWTPIRQNDITWNFEKFLINRHGIVVKRYSPSYPPTKMYDDVMDLLGSDKDNTKSPKESDQVHAEPAKKGPRDL